MHLLATTLLSLVVVVTCTTITTTVAMQGDEGRSNVGALLPADYQRYVHAPPAQSTAAAAGQQASQDAPVVVVVVDSGAQDTAGTSQFAALGQIKFQAHVICPEANTFDTTHCPSQDKLDAQLDVLNRVFRPLGFNFNMEPVNYVVDRGLAESTLMDGNFVFNARGVDVLSGQHRGGRKTLNVYVKPGNFKDNSPNLQGLTFLFPENLVDNPAWADGLYIHSGVLPGMTTFKGQFDQGHTLVHEVGHWLGLRHIFTKTCSSTDFNYGIQDDTPATTEAVLTCNAKPISCESDHENDANSAKVEPVNNFMGYTPDSCRNEFTPAQVEVMKFSFNTLRASEVKMDGTQ